MTSPDTIEPTRREILNELVRLSELAPDVPVHIAAAIDRAVSLGIFSAVQATWNLLERSAESALLEAHRAGVRVIIKEALARAKRVLRYLAGTTDFALTSAPPTSRDSGSIAPVTLEPFSDSDFAGDEETSRSTTPSNGAASRSSSDLTPPSTACSTAAPRRRGTPRNACAAWISASNR